MDRSELMPITLSEEVKNCSPIALCMFRVIADTWHGRLNMSKPFGR